MITREEFLDLYEKCLSGLCSEAERDLLKSYTDELKLSDGQWDEGDGSQAQVYHRIWEKLRQSRNPDVPLKKNNNHIWLKAAAVIILGSTAVWVSNPLPKSVSLVKQTKIKPAPAQIQPGGNKALLTLANGSRIILTDAKKGILTTQSGAQVTKSGDGILVYQPHTTAEGKSAIVPVEMNMISTPRGGQYQLVLADGTKVWLNAASVLKYPAQFTGNERRVELKGEAYFEVHKNPAAPFIVHTSGQEVRVLGTHFNIKAYSDETLVKTSLLQGRVDISSGGKTTSLLPGFEAISTQGSTRVMEADVQQSIAWKKGLFQFNNATIEEVMHQISRWYDADIVITKKPLPLRQFTGTISRQEPINEILAMLSYTGVKFSVRDKQILVQP
ncbi:FecR family protein [Pedobacter westerhofensis]|uniref:FecR family protein n=1 Tax=Pedobacter westerhofensis TaxID=425512 RepID=A0A521DDS5_9SPHI|nr:FecR domain-containing protein [Pedobacter westerhofensis]SMO69301.1 FecR family protein [Pedobacter westerhofensis]